MRPLPLGRKGGKRDTAPPRVILSIASRPELISPGSFIRKKEKRKGGKGGKRYWRKPISKEPAGGMPPCLSSRPGRREEEGGELPPVNLIRPRWMAKAFEKQSWCSHLRTREKEGGGQRGHKIGRKPHQQSPPLGPYVTKEKKEGGSVALRRRKKTPARPRSLASRIFERKGEGRTIPHRRR